MSSIRKISFPPNFFATSYANKAEKTCPKCIWPVGLGAKRVFSECKFIFILILKFILMFLLKINRSII